MKTATWKALVLEVVEQLPREFSLNDVVAKREWFARFYPGNRFIEAKIRQTLQLLRDQNVIAFVAPGRYERTGASARFSPLIHPDLAAQYTSASQAARVVIETWAEMNLYCLNCERDGLSRHAANMIGSDFFCEACSSEYQVKAKNGRFGARFPGAEYHATIDAVNRGAMPEHVLVEYDLRYNTVVFVDAVPGSSITADRIIARKPLAITARRAGWTGCTIDIDNLPKARIVAPTGLDRTSVRTDWKALQPKERVR